MIPVQKRLRDELEMVFINECYAETQEDLYYCALNSLYNLYMYHSSQH